MATTAAYLQIQIDADTGKATLDLKKLDKMLTGIDKTTATATTRTSNFGKATGKASGAFKNAARTAGTAALAYLSISQAKTAVTTTQDLAKTTAGLSRNLGLSTKKASQWGSVAKARDIDAKALTMSFTTLSRRITDAAKGSDTAVDSFKDIGVTQKQLESTNGNFNKQVLLIADAFGEAEGGAVRQQAAQKLLGRGYQTLLPLFSEGSKSLREQQMWADKYGTTLNEKTLKAQMDLVNAQRESKVAWLGIQTTFAKAVTPALMEANKQFQEIAQILGDDKLSSAEKFKKVGKIISEWGQVAFDAFVKVLPAIAERAGEAAPKIAEALFKGFQNADILGKLFLGGALLSKLITPLTLLGTRMGTTLAGGIRGGLIGVGAIGVFQSASEIEDLLGGKSSAEKVGEVWGGQVTAGVQSAFAEFKARKAAGKIREVSDETRDLIANWQEAGVEIPDDMLKIPEAGDRMAGRIEASMERLKFSIKSLRVGFAHNLDEIDKKTDRITESITSKFGTRSERAKNLMRDNYRAASRAIQRAMDAQLISVDKGTAAIEELLKKQMRTYGIQNPERMIAETENRASLAKLNKQRGGIINIGKPSGDSVPALLERGEYVLNRNAVAAAGKGNLDRLNFNTAARFATGGLVQALGPYDIPPIQYDPNHGGDNSHLHLSMASVAAAKALASKIAKLGWMASESPWAGGNTVRHSDPGHYTGSAFDANHPGGETHAEVAAVAKILGGKGGAFGAIGGARFKLPRFKALIQGAIPSAQGLNNLAAATERVMAQRVASRPVSGGFSMGNFEGSGSALMKSISKKQGWSFPDWWTVDARETSHGRNLVNPSSTARLRGQFLSMNWGKYGPGSDPGPFPGTNPALFPPMDQQIISMGRYIGERYGNTTAALAHHNAYNWYQRGGMIPTLHNGGIVPGPTGQEMLALVEGGEAVVSNAQIGRGGGARGKGVGGTDTFNQLMREFVRNQKAILQASRSERTAINAAIAAAASGQIGGRVNLGRQTPVAGSLASY